ncbi:ATP-dependent RNA helicase [Shewanella sp. D64]|uniref:helicase-related protein n=1 Tax=unclassified Shewanella TaxID=196818 RepID=UPI0022BA4DC9|nr:MULTISPECIES: helicase-related protein [unclassified Shewanella]MEC4727172.1 ATP-dependent RNA helicase [Shewanella sp. D64]MEC4739211.1 ATP-dependent RNA helicase [Shewanella sp. E94]WBJ95551.1 ATP-dependent RNA helicase [Shewanella sp. MTB7]
MMSLPIDALYDEFVLAIKNNHLVVESDTGSGKSTRLPLWCAESDSDGLNGGKPKRVLVVEPRRVACLALAGFVGAQTELDVGYAIRFDSTVTDMTQIAFVTPGIALRWLSMGRGQDGQVDEKAGLACFDIVIIDEFHERRWDTDLLLAMLKDKAAQQDNFRLILTSATIDGERLTTYLGQNSGVSAQRLQAQGRRFHVELRYEAAESHHLPDVRGVEQRVKKVVAGLLAETKGDILVFLPGKGEIQSCLQACEGLTRGSSASGEVVDLLVLHGGISASEQKAILDPAKGQRVIFATNIAETSLTIPGVTAVVDSGLERRTHQRNGRTVLSLARISKASSDQRMGRAGRTQQGICVRLWGMGAPLEMVTPPELQREELVEPMLAAAANDFRLRELSFVDRIPAKALEIAETKLCAMGAIDHLGKITAHGYKLLPLPIDTQFAHLISAMPNDECRGLMVDLAAGLSVSQRLFVMPSSDSDLKDLNEWEPLGCDALTLIKLIREKPPEFMLINQSARKEALLLSRQIRSSLGLIALDKDFSLQAGRFNLRQHWLLEVIKALPELAFIRREKRISALGNGYSEVQIGRDSRFCCELKDSQGKESAVVAVVFDQHSIAGKGSKQTLNLASCMAPISLSTLLEADLGVERLTEKREQGINHRVLVETVYAGRVIGTHLKEVEGEQAIEAIVRSISVGRTFKGLADRINNDISAWNIWVALGLSECDKPALEFTSYLSDKLSELGVESFDDLALIEADDLLFEGIPDWQRAEFDAMYPIKLALAQLKVTVEYLPRRKLVTLVYASGLRKTGPQRWELPRWLGWKIQYRKASRVIDVK